MRVLAQFDVVIPKYAADDHRMSGFYSATAKVNKLAEEQPGFIWRHTEDDVAEGARLFGEGVLYTLSMWRSVEELRLYLYGTPHFEYFKRGREWFERPMAPHVVLWWIEDVYRPTLADAHYRLDLLRANGASDAAFDLAYRQAWGTKPTLTEVTS